MARQSPNRPEADELDAVESAEAGSADVVTGSTDRALWDEVRVSPIEIALPGGAGFTLRAYRPASEVTPTQVEAAEEDPFEARERAMSARDDDDEEVVILDEEFAALVAEDGKPADGDESAADAADSDAEEQQQTSDEEVPVFLSHKGRLLVFTSPESLVAFIRSGASHDMAQLDTWATVAKRVQASDIAALSEDTYELDLVVENLRGGHDTWKLDLLIAAGEVARDLGHALRLRPVITALAPGSPLDDLDEALRAASGGAVGGFFGRRRLRKIGAQQASLGWRSVIGKISAAVDWRD